MVGHAQMEPQIAAGAGQDGLVAADGRPPGGALLDRAPGPQSRVKLRQAAPMTAWSASARGAAWTAIAQRGGRRRILDDRRRRLQTRQHRPETPAKLQPDDERPEDQHGGQPLAPRKREEAEGEPDHRACPCTARSPGRRRARRRRPCGACLLAWRRRGESRVASYQNRGRPGWSTSGVRPCRGAVTLRWRRNRGTIGWVMKERWTS